MPSILTISLLAIHFLFFTIYPSIHPYQIALSLRPLSIQRHASKQGNEFDTIDINSKFLSERQRIGYHSVINSNLSTTIDFVLNLSVSNFINESPNTNFQSIESSIPQTEYKISSALQIIDEYEIPAIGSIVNIKKGLSVYYLQHALKLKESALMNIITNYSWILYLKVETKLKPSIRVYKSFGFKEKDIRKIIENVPSVLGIEHEWTLPEKLLSLQRMYQINRVNLVKLVTTQPYLLTSSIARNLEISEYFLETLQYTSSELKHLILINPNIPMYNINHLKKCWEILIDTYGFSDEIARKLTLQRPYLFSNLLIQHNEERLQFYEKELGLIAPCDPLKRMFITNPRLLYLNPTYFFIPNLNLLRKYLCGNNSSYQIIQKIVLTHPSLLGYTPQHLESLLKKTFYFLTGDDQYTLLKVDEDEDDGIDKSESVEDRKKLLAVNALNGLQGFNFLASPDGIVDDRPFTKMVDTLLNPSSYDDKTILVDHIVVEEDEELVEDITPDLPVEDEDKDLIANIVHEFNDLMTNITSKLSNQTVEDKEFISKFDNAAMSHPLYLENHLNLSQERALYMILSAPWIISYRIERSQRLLRSLILTLGMNEQEIEKCVGMYPRMFCFSVDGKIIQMLESLAKFVVKLVHLHIQVMTLDEIKMLMIHYENENVEDVVVAGQEIDGLILCGDQSGDERMEKSLKNPNRFHLIRKVLRQMIHQYPLLVGYSLNKITSRMDSIETLSPTILRNNFPIQNISIQINRLFRRSPDQHVRWMDHIQKNITKSVEGTPSSSSPIVTVVS